jgi:Flagellar biosynthesis pathway, component FlhB
MVTATLVVIAAIDVPYQSYEFTKRMRMTKKEIKDEFKDVEGQLRSRRKSVESSVKWQSSG